MMLRIVKMVCVIEPSAVQGWWVFTGFASLEYILLDGLCPIQAYILLEYIL